MAEKLSIIESFILSRHVKYALAFAKKFVDENSQNILRDRLYKFMFEWVGLANPLLIISYILEEEKTILPKLIVALCKSPKSKMCATLSRSFYSSEARSLDPFPEKQAQMIDFSNQKVDDILQIAGALYWKGMDCVFWHLLKLKIAGGKNLRKLIEILEKKPKNELTPTVWCFALAFLYFKNIGKMPAKIAQLQDSEVNLDTPSGFDVPSWINEPQILQEPQIDQNEFIKKCENIKIVSTRSPNCEQNSQYFNVGIRNTLDFLNPGDKITKAICSYEELSIRNTTDTSIKLHEFGTLQCQFISNSPQKDYGLYCWLKNERSVAQKYFIKCFTMKKNAKLNALMDTEMSKSPFFYCSESKVICLRQYIEHVGLLMKTDNTNPAGLFVGNLKSKKLYCTITETFPYYHSIKNVTDRTLVSEKDLLVVLYSKFIYSSEHTVLDDIVLLPYDDDVTKKEKEKEGDEKEGDEKEGDEKKKEEKEKEENQDNCSMVLAIKNNEIDHKGEKIHKFGKMEEGDLIYLFLKWLNEKIENEIADIPNDVMIRMRIILTAYGL